MPRNAASNAETLAPGGRKKEEEPEMEFRHMGLQHTSCILLIKPACLLAQCVLLICRTITATFNSTHWTVLFDIHFCLCMFTEKALNYTVCQSVLIVWLIPLFRLGYKKTEEEFSFFLFHKKLHMNSISPSIRKETNGEQGWPEKNKKHATSTQKGKV